jgi:GNAT superfamily N-acetyltransferase
MSIIEENRRVTMICGDLDGVPEHPVPEGYTNRWYTPGDQTAWTKIQAGADPFNSIGAGLFEREFGDDMQVLGRRQCFLCKDGHEGGEIGTATAWCDKKRDGGRMGLVHWVAILPEFQGAGLSKPLMSTVCARMRDLGHRRARLVTSTGRIPAINLYLYFGFLPEMRSKEDKENWRLIREHLKYPC